MSRKQAPHINLNSFPIRPLQYSSLFSISCQHLLVVLHAFVHHCDHATQFFITAIPLLEHAVLMIVSFNSVVLNIRNHNSCIICASIHIKNCLPLPCGVTNTIYSPTACCLWLSELKNFVEKNRNSSNDKKFNAIYEVFIVIQQQDII